MFGDPNLYRYLGNAPTVWSDPTGLGNVNQAAAGTSLFDRAGEFFADAFSPVTDFARNTVAPAINTGLNILSDYGAIAGPVNYVVNQTISDLRDTDQNTAAGVANNLAQQQYEFNRTALRYAVESNTGPAHGYTSFRPVQSAFYFLQDMGLERAGNYLHDHGLAVQEARQMELARRHEADREMRENQAIYEEHGWWGVFRYNVAGVRNIDRAVRGTTLEGDVRFSGEERFHMGVGGAFELGVVPLPGGQALGTATRGTVRLASRGASVTLNTTTRVAQATGQTASTFRQGFRAGVQQFDSLAVTPRGVVVGSNGGRAIQPAAERLGAGIAGGARATVEYLPKNLRSKLRKIEAFTSQGGLTQVTGRVSSAEARTLAERFVGRGFTETLDPKFTYILRSRDGLRQVRGPSIKPTDQGRNIHPISLQPYSNTGVQVKFQSRSIPSGNFKSNVHLDVG
ncbi:MAG: hypothetical protein AAGD32_15340 [Planctomycetota bacterium]